MFSGESLLDLFNFGVKFSFWGGGIFASLGVLGITAVWFFQERMLYYPTVPAGSRTSKLLPEMFHISGEEVWIKTRDGISLNALFFPTPSRTESPTILMLHGNAGNIGMRIPSIPGYTNLANCNVLLLEYRGYGFSEGPFPTEEGLIKDAIAGLDYLFHQRTDIDSNKIFVFGRSLGGAVAIQAAAAPDYRAKIAGLIVENTFTSVSAMVDSLFPPYLAALKKWLLRLHWASDHHLPAVQAPILFLAGARDELVPHSMMQKLHSLVADRPTTKFSVFESGTHMDTWQAMGYFDSLKRFVESPELASKQQEETAES
eukprot:GCRY01002532.1.p1 GENE.GCRY01002532.1~~GCRY01002532.1.p1  ORF type:complete len:315 (+),score=54.51 GCRY01002532.1:303-1247(+)